MFIKRSNVLVRQANSSVSMTIKSKLPVGAHIHDVLDQKLERIQLAMEAELGQTSLEQVVADAESDEGLRGWGALFSLDNYDRMKS